MIGYPLDSVVQFNEGVPEYDRAISSAPLRELIKRLYTDGILPDRSTDLQVQYVGSTRVSGNIEGATETYNVVVNPGFGICNGCLKLQEIYYGLEMSIASATNPRIDTVVLRLDDNFDVRACTFDIIQGVESSNPTPPTLTRNSTVWEIGLANIYKPAVVSVSNPITVTDTRLDSSRCGIISSVGEFDTTAFYNQIQNDLDYFKSVSEAEFLTWFTNLQTQLSGNMAGNLQNQIGTLSQLRTINKINLVSAINEILSRSIPSVPTRNLTPVSSQSLDVNPIPMSWEQTVDGMVYRNGEYAITASRFEENGEAYKAFDGNQSTAWSANVISGASLMLELPTAMLIDKMYLVHTAPPASVLTIEYSENGYSWVTDTVLESSTTNGMEVNLAGNTAKYWRLNFSAAGNTVVNVFNWELSDYTITIYEANYTISNLPELVSGQSILVHIYIEDSATGITANTLNGVPIQSILQAGKKYELTYNMSYYTAKEIE